MICKRCQRSLRSGEGLKCGICESCFHLRCVGDGGKEHRDSGDRGYQWKCSLCQNYVNNLHASGSESSRDKDSSLLEAINALSEKFELVNKIQLPKLNSDLANIKSIVDHIVQQNENILKKIDEIEEKRKSEKQLSNCSTSKYRKRSLNFTPKANTFAENGKSVYMTVADKSVRYRTRRQSYILNRILRLLNRKITTTNSPRKR